MFELSLSLAAMDHSPSCHQEKRSKTTQDHSITACLSGHTKAVCPCAGPGGSHARSTTLGQDRHASSVAGPPPTLVGQDPVVEAEEEALERASRTIAVLVDQSLHQGPQHVIHQLVLFDDLKPTVREPQLAPNHDGWAPPRPVDYRHNVHDIRSQRA